MARPRRLSPEVQQERQSVGQFQATFHEWAVQPTTVDCGEDVIVQIYDDGRSANLTFAAQLKSCTDLAARTIKKGAVVSYGFEVKDLKHWEHQSTPVVLFVWDVVTSTGVWLDVTSAIEDLDDRVPGWRRQGTVKAHVPRSNTTDDAGRKALRKRVLDLLWPTFKDKPAEFTTSCRFSRDAEGQASRTALTRAIEEGEPATISGMYVVGMKASDWWEAVQGGPIKPIESISFLPCKSDKTLGVTLKAVGPERSESLTSTLRTVRAGTRLTTMTNEHEDVPYRLRLLVRTPKKGPWTADARFSFSYPGSRVSTTLPFTRFLLAYHDAGKLDWHIGDDPIGFIGVEQLEGSMPKRKALLAWERLLVKMSFIENKFRRFGSFDLNRERTNGDFGVIDRLYDAAKTNTWRDKPIITMRFDPKWTPPPKIEAGGDFWLELQHRPVEALGLKVPIERVRVEFEAPEEALAICHAAHAQGADIRISGVWATTTVLSFREPDEHTPE